jgi:hypothetical protein
MTEVKVVRRLVDPAFPDMVVNQSRTFQCECGVTVTVDFLMNQRATINNEHIQPDNVRHRD